jgi:hypothetical protein
VRKPAPSQDGLFDALPAVREGTPAVAPITQDNVIIGAAYDGAVTMYSGCHPCTRCGRFVFPRPTVCYWCRESLGA